MDKQRLQELAGVQLNEAAGIYSAVFDGGDGTFMGIVGPFHSVQMANEFFTKHWGSDVRIESVDIDSPEQFLKDMDD